MNNIEAFYLPKSDTAGLILFDTINGVHIDSIRNNYSQEMITIFEIISEEAGWLEVKTTYYSEEIFGWVEPSKLQVRIGKIEEPISLYKEPDLSSPEMVSITGKRYARVINIVGSWTKVEFLTDNDKLIRGWLNSKTCGNPYTYCN